MSERVPTTRHANGLCSNFGRLNLRQRLGSDTERTAIASHIFNADHFKIAADDRLPNLDHRKDKEDRGEGRLERSTAERLD
jgi:hypothetical protein